MALKHSKSGDRLSILNDKEIDALYEIPEFSQENRLAFFDLSEEELEALERSRSISAKVYFILQLGYFKAKQQFFIFEFDEIKADVQYILKRHFDDISELREFSQLTVQSIPKMSRINQQKRILKLCNYHLCKNHVKVKVSRKIADIVKEYSHPVYVFRKLLIYFENERIVLPGYSTLQKMIGTAINQEVERLEKQIKEHMPKAIKASLEELLLAEESLHEITILKKEARNFTYSQMKKEISKKHQFLTIYDFAKDFLPLLGLSSGSISYYASLVDFYSVYKLKRMKGKRRNKSYLYLLCYVYNRLQKINDNLVKSLIYYVRDLEDKGKEIAKLRHYKDLSESNQSMKEVAKILELFEDEEIPDDSTFGEVRELAYKYLEKEKLSLISKYLSEGKLDQKEYQWTFFDEKENYIRKNVRPIFMNIHFESQTKNDLLIKAATTLQTAFNQKKSYKQISPDSLPQKRFIPKNILKYLYTNHRSSAKELKLNRYEFFVDKQLKNGMESGKIYTRDSLSFKSLEDDLIDKQLWEKDKGKLIQQVGLPLLSKPIDEILTDLEDQLEKKIKKVNRDIAHLFLK